MSNYLVLCTASSLIVNVICSTKLPTDNSDYRFIKVSEAVLDKYYKLAGKKPRNGTYVDTGELAAVSPAFFERLHKRQ